MKIHCERERQHADLAVKAKDLLKLEEALDQIVAAINQCIAFLTTAAANTEGLLKKGHKTRRA